MSDGITPSRLPALLALCRQEEPEVEIRFFEVPLSQQIKGLHDDLYDVGFAQSDEVGDGIVAVPAWSDALMVAVPARHPLLAHKRIPLRSEEHTSELQSLMRSSYAVFCLKKNNTIRQ